MNTRSIAFVAHLHCVDDLTCVSCLRAYHDTQAKPGEQIDYIKDRAP